MVSGLQGFGVKSRVYRQLFRMMVLEYKKLTATATSARQEDVHTHWMDIIGYTYADGGKMQA